jgi:hypothetical protein
MGFLLSLLLGFLVITMGWSGELSGWGVQDIPIFAFALAVGFFFPRTIGIGLTGLQVGSIVTVIISLFRGDFSGVWVSCVIFGGASIVQILITLLRPGASASVGAYVGTDIWRRFRP